jgi:hypothetical protein
MSWICKVFGHKNKELLFILIIIIFCLISYIGLCYSIQKAFYISNNSIFMFGFSGFALYGYAMLGSEAIFRKVNYNNDDKTCKRCGEKL